MPKWNSREFFEFVAAEEVSARLADGADPDETDRDGRTPLHHAAVHGRPLVVTLLMDAGATVRRDRFGWTPLHCAAAAEGRPWAIIPFVTSGADVNARTDRGQTPLHFAAMHGTTASVQLLLGAGADREALDAGGRSPGCLALEAGHDDVADMIRSPHAPAWIGAREGERLAVGDPGPLQSIEVMLLHGARDDRGPDCAYDLLADRQTGRVGLHLHWWQNLHGRPRRKWS